MEFSSFHVFIFFFTFLWFLVFTKKFLFWVYLWQLKEYHLGRFLAHFDTFKGKRLIFNSINLIEVFLILFFLIYPFLFPLPNFLSILLWYLTLILVFLLQGGKIFLDILKKNLKTPILTKKTALILFLGFSFQVGIISLLFSQNFWIWTISLFPFLILDFFAPLISSAIILATEPVAIFWRGQIIEKAKKKRAQLKNLLVIAITGSYGKTSTKEFLATILADKFRVLKTKEHQNSEVGISQCILNDLKPEHQIFVVEMGAYNRGGIKLLCDIAKPKIGILTGINEQHLATFGSQENIIKTKFELIEALPKDGIAFFNGKNKYCSELYDKTKIQKRLYGQEASFPGEENILGARAVAKGLGMTNEEISRGVEKIENKFGGIQIKKGINGLNIIDATYSANPDGVIAHLEYLKTFRQGRSAELSRSPQARLVIIMPCLIELGSASQEVHKRIGQKIGQVCDLAIITTKDKFKKIKEGAGEKAVFIENPKEIFEKIKNFCEADDVILLEGRIPNEVIKLLSK